MDNIDLTVRRGESLAIIGKNGAGKSTLLKIISGVIKPSKGEVRVNGKIGALLELGSGFHPEYTGRENLKMSAALAGLTKKSIEKSIGAMIEFADIGEYIDQPVKNYSSGMVVRLGFSVITVTNPDLLITDEVLAVGDVEFQRKCIKWLDNYLSQGGTLLLVSHSIYHVQKLCKHAIWLENGKIKSYGDAFTVSQEYQSHYEKITEDKLQNTEKDINNYHVDSFALLNSQQKQIGQIESNEDLLIRVVVHSPDDRPPGLALGIVRKDVPVYGMISEQHAGKPKKLSDRKYEFVVKYPKLKLLPADYEIKAHAMDPECLRVLDENILPLRVQSNTTDMGVVELETEWL